MTRKPEIRTGYHHGDLPRTLVREGAALLAERGVDGFSMREVARRAGVAVAAPSHHFGNAKGLLTAIATDGFERLAERQQHNVDAAKTPLEAVVALCLGYVETATLEPGHAAVMFRLDLVEPKAVRFREAAFAAFDQLVLAVQNAAPKGMPERQVSLVAKSLWATAHGVRTLTMLEPGEGEAIIRTAAHALLD